MTSNDQKITVTAEGELVVPEHPTIPFIEGDGTGPDIWRATRLVLEAAVDKAYGGERAIAWREVLAGESVVDDDIDHPMILLWATC